MLSWMVIVTIAVDPSAVGATHWNWLPGLSGGSCGQFTVTETSVLS
jgi:hypothetical protein